MLPNTHNLIATSLHIGILRGIQPHALSLARIRLRKQIRVAMPVITVELDNKPYIGHESVNAELATDDVLWKVDNAQAVEQPIADPLNSRLVAALLRCVHLDQHCPPIRVGVATIERAVCDLEHLARRRPSKRLSAYFAGVGILIATLPGDLMLKTAKIVFYLANTTFRQIKRGAAVLARNLLPILTRRRLAGSRAKPLAAFGGRLERLSAYFACRHCMARCDAFAGARAESPAILATGGWCILRFKGLVADFAGFFNGWHMLIIPHNAATIKPITLTGYIATQARVAFWRALRYRLLDPNADLGVSLGDDESGQLSLWEAA